MKAFEDRVVRDTNLQNMAVGNALANVYRRRHSPAIPLWQKPQTGEDIEQAKRNVQAILEMEERDGKSWVEKIWSKHRQSRRR